MLELFERIRQIISTVLVLFIHEIITPENYKFFKGAILWIRSPIRSVQSTGPKS